MDDLIEWYKSCNYEITLSQSNKTDKYTGFAFCKDTNNSYKSTGITINDVLFDLKSMINGTYFK